MPILKLRNLLWAFPLLLAVTSPLWLPPLADFLRPRGDYRPPETATTPQTSHTPSNIFTMDGVVMTLSTAGSEEWRITADRAFTANREDEIEMLTVQALYIGTTKDPVKVTSKRGIYDMRSRHLVLIDQVELNNPQKKQQLFTEQLHYDEDSSIMTSPGKVRLLSPTVQLQGGSMDYNLDNGTYKFKKTVNVIL